MKKRIIAVIVMLALAHSFTACGDRPTSTPAASLNGQTESISDSETKTEPLTETVASADPLQTLEIPEQTELPQETDPEEQPVVEGPFRLIRETEMRYTLHGSTFSVKVPYLLGEAHMGGDASFVEYGDNQKANREIARMAANTVISAVSLEYPGQHDFKYEVHVWNDILALVVSYEDSILETVTNVYLVDSSDEFCRHLSTRELLARMRIPEAYFLSTLSQQMREIYEKNWGDSPFQEENPEEYNRELELAGSAEMITLDLMAYPDENGNLFVVVPCVSPVGGGSYMGIVQLNVIEEERLAAVRQEVCDVLTQTQDRVSLRSIQRVGDAYMLTVIRHTPIVLDQAGFEEMERYGGATFCGEFYRYVPDGRSEWDPDGHYKYGYIVGSSDQNQIKYGLVETQEGWMFETIETAEVNWLLCEETEYEFPVPGRTRIYIQNGGSGPDLDTTLDDPAAAEAVGRTYDRLDTLSYSPTEDLFSIFDSAK